MSILLLGLREKIPDHGSRKEHTVPVTMLGYLDH